MKIPEQVVAALHQAREHHFLTLSTLGRSGWPHTRPMHVAIVGADGETLLFASRNPGDTAANLRRNRRAEVLVAHRGPIGTGFNLEGWAEYREEAGSVEWQALAAYAPDFPIVGVFVFSVQRIRVATPARPETGQLLPGGEQR